MRGPLRSPRHVWRTLADRLHRLTSASPVTTQTKALYSSTDTPIEAKEKTSPARGKTVNEFFDKIYVLNLDRRPDRWERLIRDAEFFGVSVDRFSAVDGRSAPSKEQYADYTQQALVQVPKALRIKSSYQVYRDYPSDSSRVAFFEQRDQKKAIASPGAWGYLSTMIQIIEDALIHEYEHILVLDDDVIFHKQFNELFAQTIGQVPESWKILQLGTLQYEWEEKWISPFSENLYLDHGSGLGSHAVGMHRSVLPMVLEYCLRMDLPYDEGPLHKPRALFPEQCFTFHPNILIQDVSESDISNTTNQQSVMSRKNNQYRWKMNDYHLPD